MQLTALQICTAVDRCTAIQEELVIVDWMMPGDELLLMPGLCNASLSTQYCCCCCCGVLLTDVFNMR